MRERKASAKKRRRQLDNSGRCPPPRKQDFAKAYSVLLTKFHLFDRENERPEEPVDEQLGRIVFVTSQGRVEARQTQSGHVIYQGQRFSLIREWLQVVFRKRV